MADVKNTSYDNDINISDNSAIDILQLVTFNLGKEEFAVDILNIQSINRMMEITIVPNSPTFVEGIINLRGQVIPVIDLRDRLELAKKEYDKHSRIIVVNIDSKIIGFIVDLVNEVLRIQSNITEPPPQIVAGIDSEFITAVAKLDDRLITLLDLKRLLSEDEIAQATNIE